MQAKISTETQELLSSFTANAIATRSNFIRQVIDGGNKDLNTECGYPDTLTAASDFALMYAREGIGARVVDVYPKECWSKMPYIYETEDPEQVTEFEAKLKEIDTKHKLMSMMFRADKLSGVGRFGVILLGINDGKPLYEPVDTQSNELLYIRTFDESVVTITSFETDTSNERFGLPVKYSINFTDGAETFSQTVHWHRIVHLADNREMSDVYGVPRMQKIYNRLLDVRKVLGGSAEMFWKGGFPGFALKTDPNVELDATAKAAAKEEMEDYMLSLQRYMALDGFTVESISPQIADPSNNFQAHLEAISISEGIPKRILFGSEQGELASSQDAKAWNRRLQHRQEAYLTPFVVRPVIDKLIEFGILPEVEYTVEWPDLMTQTDLEKAEVAKAWSEALSKYVIGGVEQVIPVAEFLTMLGNLTSEQVAQIRQATDDLITEEYDMGAEDDM